LYTSPRVFLLPSPDLLPKSLDKFHGRFLVALAIRRQARIPIQDRLFELLARHLYATALVEADVESALPLVASRQHSGYLKGRVNGSDIFVPWHLADVFPSVKIAESMEHLARSVQLDSEGAICLSGSSVFRGAVPIVGDIDFCEYVSSIPTRIPALIDQLIERRTDAPLLRIYLPRVRPKADFHAPWQESMARLSARFEVADPASAPVLMLEHIFKDEVVGLLPCTNRALPVAPDEPDEGHGKTTFVFQEAVISSAGAPPRTLINALELADYVVWLREQLRHTSDEDAGKKLNAVKRLKRALCLARLIHLHELANEAVAMLNHPHIESYVRNEALASLRELTNYLPAGPTASGWRSALKELTIKVQNQDDVTRSAIEARADQVVERIATAYDYIADEILQVDPNEVTSNEP
jgi:hypothetical protein